MLIYNGDWDACVPYTDNEGWTTGMGFNATAPWHPWMYADNGAPRSAATRTSSTWRARRRRLTFVTVRGGRHEVPETAPDRAFAMFQNFLAGTSSERGDTAAARAWYTRRNDNQEEPGNRPCE